MNVNQVEISLTADQVGLALHNYLRANPLKQSGELSEWLDEGFSIASVQGPPSAKAYRIVINLERARLAKGVAE